MDWEKKFNRIIKDTDANLEKVKARVMQAQSAARSGQAGAAPGPSSSVSGGGESPTTDSAGRDPRRLRHCPSREALYLLCQNQARELTRVNAQIRQLELENENVRAELLKLRRDVKQPASPADSCGMSTPTRVDSVTYGEAPPRDWRRGGAQPEQLTELQLKVDGLTEKDMKSQTRLHDLERRLTLLEHRYNLSAAAILPPMAASPPPAHSPPACRAPSGEPGRPLDVMEFHFPSEQDPQPGDPVRVHPPGSDPLGNLDLDDLALSDRSGDEH